MTDMGKVFDAFRNCITEPKCKDCPWEQCEQFNQKKVTIPVTLALDVLELLKQQREMPKLVEIDGQLATVKYGHCPTCGEGLNQEVYPHWCGFCGQAVKWDAAD